MSELKDINKKIGEQIMRQRRVRGLTQKHIGRMLGVSLQQVQKYEKGISRISAEKLHALSQALGIPYGIWFGDEFAPESDAPIRPHDAQAARLIRDYYAIRSPETRALLCTMAHTLTSCRPS